MTEQQPLQSYDAKDFTEHYKRVREGKEPYFKPYRIHIFFWKAVIAYLEALNLGKTRYSRLYPEFFDKSLYKRTRRGLDFNLLFEKPTKQTTRKDGFIVEEGEYRYTGTLSTKSKVLYSPKGMPLLVYRYSYGDTSTSQNAIVMTPYGDLNKPDIVTITQIFSVAITIAKQMEIE
jgi:hypothetical protein